MQDRASLHSSAPPAPSRRKPIQETPQTRFQAFGARDIDRIPELRRLSRADRDAMKAVSAVFPFRVNRYVIEELIRWEDAPGDAFYQLTFPQPGMLESDDFDRMYALVRDGASDERIAATARSIQLRLNPHPAGQLELNVPRIDGKPVEGMQHKYRETVLFFPSQGQTCHAYCTYCFRWAQFVGLEDYRFSSREVDDLVEYLRQHKEVTSVLITGGDPLVMRTKVLRRYVEPLLAADLEHVHTIRLGSKAPAYWPQRFVTDSDADDLLRLFEEVGAAGRHLALMGHYSHPRELEPEIAKVALRRVLATGASVRCQAPLIRRVNDRPHLWSDMWNEQVRLGAVPYYMFVERDTGARGYFEVPLAKASRIYQKAIRSVGGLARTVRGPSMSATPGKVVVDGITHVGGEKVFALRFLQARDPDWVGRPFFARFDPEATWLDDLEPATGCRFPHHEWEQDRVGQQ